MKRSADRSSSPRNSIMGLLALPMGPPCSCSPHETTALPSRMLKGEVYLVPLSLSPPAEPRTLAALFRSANATPGTAFRQPFYTCGEKVTADIHSRWRARRTLVKGPEGRRLWRIASPSPHALLLIAGVSHIPSDAMQMRAGRIVCGLRACAGGAERAIVCPPTCPHSHPINCSPMGGISTGAAQKPF